MMLGAVDNVLYNGSRGVIGAAVKKMANSQGILLKELNLCTLDGLVVTC